MPVRDRARAAFGIGGLTLALALRQRGLTADVYEQASELREIGAAVALATNGTRGLKRLGCLDAIAALSAQPSGFIYAAPRPEAFGNFIGLRSVSG